MSTKPCSDCHGTGCYIVERGTRYERGMECERCRGKGDYRCEDCNATGLARLTDAELEDSGQMTALGGP